MKKALVLGLMLASTTALADCYMRSSINLAQQTSTLYPKDIQKLVVPDAHGQKCVVNYRVNIDGTWHTAEGEGVGATEEQACQQALKPVNGAVLGEVTPKRIRADNQMVCSDLPEIRVRPVRIGDVVWESETDVHVIPEFRRYFVYKRSLCRLFAERDNRNQNLMLYQGVVCQISNTPNSKWRVIDKF